MKFKKGDLVEVIEEEPREEKNKLLKFFKNLLTGKKD